MHEHKYLLFKNIPNKKFVTFAAKYLTVNKMNIDKNTVATLVYSIHLNDAYGKLIEDAQKEPKELVFGFDKMISGFEDKLMGMNSGDDFSFNLRPDESFGDFREDMLVSVPKTAFMVNGKLRDDLMVVGNGISMMDNNGRPMKGIVKEILDESIKMDFNHPLAGESLFVVGKVLNIREITAEDLEPESGCGCGSGDGGCSTEKEHAHDDGGCGCGSGCGC